ncbi:retrovirus-related pol polyprotein from transposon TNT 1-94 [Tanacetum coccineum]
MIRPHPKRNFVPTAVAIKLGQVPVNAAKQNSPKAAASISTAMPINTAAPKSKVNDALPKIYSYFKAHSPCYSAEETKAKRKKFRASLSYRLFCPFEVFSGAHAPLVMFMCHAQAYDSYLDYVCASECLHNHKPYLGGLSELKIKNIPLLGSLEVIPSSKEIKFKFLQSLESNIKKKKKRPKAGKGQSRTFTIVINKCPLTRFTSTKVVALKEILTTKSVVTLTQGIMVNSRRPKAPKSVGCLNCYVIAKIIGYGDYQIGNVTISRVYYIEGLRHNLFSVGQFYDSDLEVAFRKHTCFVHNLEGVVLLMGSRGTNLYTLSIGDMMKSSPIYLLSKASKTESCKKQSHKSKSKDTNQEKLYLLHMDLCGPMHVESTNGKKYILVIVDDYSWFTWVKFLRSKDEAPEFIINFLKMIQVRLNAAVRNIHTDNGTEFVNQILRNYYEDVGISHETSVARTPQQNVAATCYTQNCSLLRLRHGKTPYELLHDIKPDLSYLYVFGALCYPTNDSDDLGKLKAKADVGIFIGYAPTKKAYRIYNRCTRRIMETIHVDFDELTVMASEQSSSGPALHEMTPRTLSSGLVPQPPSSTPFVPPTRNNWDTLLQPLFDEYFRPPPCVDHPVPKVATPVPAISTSTSSLILVDQDAPSPSTLQTPQESPSHVIPPGTKEVDHDIEVAHMDNNPQFGIPILEPSSEESSSHVVIPNNVHSVNQPPEHISKWTKDHPIDNVIGDPSRPVSTRHQLQNEALFYYFDAFLSSVEPKSYKEALTESFWIEAM